VIFPSNRVRIMVATKPIDLRKGHDGLAALVKNELHKDPFTLCPASECGAFTERGHGFCVPVAQGGSAEVTLLGEPLTRH
jgi:transposase